MRFGGGGFGFGFVSVSVSVLWLIMPSNCIGNVKSTLRFAVLHALRLQPPFNLSGFS